MAPVFYLAVLLAVFYSVAKILLPEMKKPLPQSSMPDAPQLPSRPTEIQERLLKLEELLAEKNRNITLLQTELKVFHNQVRHFDKVKTLLQEEILRLREQNRIFRSELGLPASQPKENSAQLFL